MTAQADSSHFRSRVRSVFASDGAMSAQDATQAVNSTPSTQPPASNPIPISTQVTSDDLDLLDQVMSEAEAKASAPAPVSTPVSVPITTPTPIQPAQQTASAPLPQAGTSFKERAASAPDQSTVEAATGIQYVEEEKAPEIPPEVESYLQSVQDQSSQAPQEIVIADQAQAPLATNYPKQSVLVLPITPEEEKAGKNKSPKLSIRWLVEWSLKLIKKFSGKIIYRQVEAN